jgi:hypothetical protein
MKEKYERVDRLNVKIRILFCRDNSWTIVLRQIKFGTVKYHGPTRTFYTNNYIFHKVFKYVYCGKF